MEHKKLDMKAHLKEKFGRPIQKIYFIGIGGSSMSGLALIAIDQGFDVAGSDIVSSKYTEKLAGKGATIHIGQRAENIGDDIDMAVFTAAVHEDNPEMIRANALDIPLVERSDYLGLLSQVFPKTIGVAGTHGKTTTSSLSLIHI